MSPRHQHDDAGSRRHPSETTVLHVGGLYWAGTVRGVENVLGAQPGVRQVEANAVSQTALALPIAAGVFASSGLTLRPEIAALSMSASNLILAVNALFLQRLRLPGLMQHSPGGSTPITEQTDRGARVGRSFR